MAAGVTKEMVLFQRHSDSLWYPTITYLRDVLLKDYAVRRMAHGDLTQGDPVPRSVFHCRKLLPSVVLIRGVPGSGKSWLAHLVGADASKIVSLDYVVSRIANGKYHHTPLQRFIRDTYKPDSLGLIYSGIDQQGLTDEYAALLAEAVAPSDRLVVIEGVITDAQAVALRKRLGDTAVIWDALRRT